jgi:glycine/D-amino acid oxidase-like deaminating enzyme
MMVTRRNMLIGSGAAAAMLGGGRLRAAAAVPGAGRKVVVIGAGIIGASIAYHLAAAGAKVTVIETQKPTAGATMNSFAWLNAGGKRPRPYHTMNLLGIMGWHRLQDEIGIGALPMQWGGCVEWAVDADHAGKLRTAVERAQAWGYPTRLIETSQIVPLLPGVAPGPAALAIFSSVEGTVNPIVATQALLGAAQKHGATVEYPVSVTGFESKDGRVARILTSKGAVLPDEVVLAAGLGCEPLARMLGSNIPMTSSPGVLAHTVAAPIALPRLAFPTGANIKQNPDGSFVTGSDFGGTPGVEPTREVGESLLAAARRFVPAMAGAKLDYVTLGHRVLPSDGFPVVGHLPTSANTYVAAMHSGMTQAPLIGELATIELLGGPRVDLLETFRPERFA